MNIKNRPYYFFNDIVNIKAFDPNSLSIDKKHLKVLMLLLIILNVLQ